jgi:hypothetical protein
VTSSTDPEEGSALIIALVFVTVMGLVVLALLSQTTGNLKATRVARATADKTYAADAGLEEAIERLRLDPTLCSAPADDEPNFATITVNEHEVELSCQTEIGESAGAGGWAVVITGADEHSFDVKGGSEDKVLYGPTYIANLTDDNKAWVVENGTLYEGEPTSSCDLSATTPPFDNIDVRPNPPFRYRCTTSGPPSIPHDLPSRPTPENALPTPAAPGGCTVFSPGTYSGAGAGSALNLEGDKYFESGTYYFEDIGTWEIDGNVIGGSKDETEDRHITDSPCSSVSDGSSNGTGVKFIFGGASRLLATQDRVELFRRTAGTEGGQMGISLQAAADEAGYKAINLPVDEPLIEATGNKTELYTNGAVYAPDSFVYVQVNKTAVVFNGGLVLRRFDFDSSNNISNVLVSSASSPEVRQIIVTAEALGQDGTRTVTGTAVIDLFNNAERVFDVQSWRVK